MGNVCRYMVYSILAAVNHQFSCNFNDNYEFMTMTCDIEIEIGHECCAV